MDFGKLQDAWLRLFNDTYKTLGSAKQPYKYCENHCLVSILLFWSDSSHKYSNYSSIQTFNESGATDFTALNSDYQTAYSTLEQDAGYILKENLQDRSVRAGLTLAGWKPKRNMEAQAVEWLNLDFEYASTPVNIRDTSTNRAD